MATVMAKCSKCKQFFEMDEDLFNHRKKCGSRINCPDCLKKSHENKYKKASETHKKNWASYDPEARAKRVQNAKEGIHNMSDEKKALRSLHSSIATKKYMDSLSEEVKQHRSEMITKQMIERNANMTHEKYIHYAQAVAITTNERGPTEKQKPTVNEQKFIDEYLNKYGIPFRWQYYNTTEHPKFNELFSSNPVTGGKFVNPFHRWDFYIQGPNGWFLLDVDGSTHFKEYGRKVHPQTKIEYSRHDDAAFKDSQRPYQRDDLPAYIIQAPKDDVNDDCTVIDVVTNKTCKLGAFINQLKKLQFTDNQLDLAFM